MSPRAEAAQRMAGFFDLQLRFADVIAARTGLAAADAVLHFTCLHRRFGLGDGRQRAAPEWAHYIEELARCNTPASRLAWTQAFYAQQPPETLPAGQTRFGVFSSEAPDAEGTLRFHFPPLESPPAVSPLARSELPQRLADFRDLFAFVRRTYPQAKRVRGASWLYHLEAYRRLFPPDYIASCRLREGEVPLSGLSSWGQFIDHRGVLREEAARTFEARWATLDPRDALRAFPLPMRVAEAPVESFHAFHGT